MKKQQALQPPNRGTIIVDTGILIDLSADIPTAKRKSRVGSGRLLEILPILANLGFHIAIPEEVVYEATRHIVMEDELKNRNAYFPGTNDRMAKYFRGELRLIKNIYEGKMPNMEILRSDDLPGEAADFTRRLHEVVRKYSEPSDESRSELMGLDRSKPKDYADRVIDRHVSKLRDAPGTQAIYVLSMDRGALTRVNEHVENKNRPVYLVDTPGFLKALKANGLFKKLHLKDDVTATQLLEIIAEHKGMQKSRSINMPSGYVDSSCVPGKNHNHDTPWYLNDQPFNKAMRALTPPISLVATQNELMRHWSVRIGEGNQQGIERT